MRGTEEHPIRTINELKTAVQGRKDCILYTYGCLQIDDELLQEIKVRHITLMAMAQATLTEKISAPIIKEVDLRNIKIAEDTIVTIDMNELSKQIANSVNSRFMNF